MTTTVRKIYESGEDPEVDDEDEDIEDIDITEDEIDDSDGDIDDEIYEYSNEANVTNKNLIKGEGTNRKWFWFVVIVDEFFCRWWNDFRREEFAD